MANNWSGYPNGRIPTNKMVLFRSTGKYMQPDAANWLGRLLDAASAAGHTFTILPSEDLYRDYARQVYFWNNQRELGIVAAPPGTSNHGWALAADVDGTENAAAWAWLLNNSLKYNYKLKTVPTEKWHWVYIGPTTTPASSGATPIPVETPSQEDDEDEMTEILYYANLGASTDAAKTVPLNSMWYQRSPGDALVKLGDVAADSSEYTSLLLKNKARIKPYPDDTFRRITDGDTILGLINLRGQVPSYS